MATERSTTARRGKRHRGRLVGTFVVIAILVVGAEAAAQDSHRTVTRAEAPAIATAINLRYADLPALRPGANPITSRERALDEEFTRCVGGVANSRAYAAAQSPTFTSSRAAALAIDSTTEILPSAALVRRDLAATSGPNGIPCLERQLRGVLSTTVPRGDTLQISATRPQEIVAGSDGAFLLRFTAAVGVRQGSSTVAVPLYYDSIGIAYGQIEIGLQLESSGTPPSPALEHRLAVILLDRALTAIG